MRLHCLAERAEQEKWRAAHRRLQSRTLEAAPEICGLPVLGSLQRVSGGWDNGWVYDPEQGAQFDAAIELVTRDRLTLTGYKGVKFFSKSFTWRRAPADLPRCDQPREARATPGDVRAATPNTTAAQASAPQVKAPRPVPAVRPAAVE